MSQQQYKNQQPFTRDDYILARLNDIKDDIQKLDKRLDKVDARFDKIDERINRLEKDQRSTIWHTELLTLGAFGVVVAVIVFVFTH